MKTYFHFDRNGNFLRTVAFLTEDAPAMLAADGKPRNIEVLPQPDHDPKTEYVVRGRLGWEVKTHPVSQVKSDAVSSINSELKTRLDAGVIVGANRYGATQDDQASWIAALTSLALAERISGNDISDLPAQQFLGPILALGGKPVDPQPTVRQLRTIIAQIATAIAAHRVKSVQLISAVEAAKDASEAVTVKWRD
jgi:hypothetical protein